jgi:hypothetical protein
MPFVEEPVDPLALPPDIEVEPRSDCLRDGNEVCPGHSKKLSSFNSADHTSGYAGPVCEIRLPPTMTLPQRANDATEPPTIHDAASSQCRLTWALLRRRLLQRRARWVIRPEAIRSGPR